MREETRGQEVHLALSQTDDDKYSTRHFTEIGVTRPLTTQDCNAVGQHPILKGMTPGDFDSGRFTF